MDPDTLEDYHYFGTELEENEPGRRWEAARGQKRLYGAFTGGFSAGYDNTAGSAYGWQPSTDKTRKQSVEDFLDDDELEEYNKTVLAAKAKYDTFGLGARERAQRDLETAEDGARSLMLVPSVMVAPVAQGTGVRLLLRMGWRHGKGVQYDNAQVITQLMDHAKSMRDLDGLEDGVRRSLKVNDAKVLRMRPKMDSFGLGYDPYQGAEEFRRKKTNVGGEHGRGGGRGARGGRGRHPGIAFGTGVVDDDDDGHILEDYVTQDAMALPPGSGSGREQLLDASGMPLLRHHGVGRERLGDRLLREGYSFEIQDDDDHNDDGPLLLGGSASVPLLTDHVDGAAGTSGGLGRDEGFYASILPGFIVADDDVLPMAYPRPHIERDFVPRVPSWVMHKSSTMQRRDVKPAPEPADPQLKLRIDQVALQVARSGADFEALAATEEGASFIAPGDPNHEYYLWKVHRYAEMVQRSGGTNANEGLHGHGHGHGHGQSGRAATTIEERSRMLGEKQLERLEEDRKKMEALMASKFVRAGASAGDSPATQKTAVIDMSKRPPLVRTVQSWAPEPLLLKRLGIDQDEDEKAADGSKKTKKGKSKKKRGGIDGGRGDRGAGYEREDEEAERDQEGQEDAALAANAFLDELLAEAPVNPSGIDNDNSDNGNVPAALVRRPLDLFQAIFEDGEDEEAGGGANDGGDEARFMPVALHDATRGHQRPERRGRRADKHEPPAPPIVQRHHQQPRPPVPPPVPPPQQPVQPIEDPPTDRATLDDERILRALRVLEKEKRRKEKKKRRAEREKKRGT